ncbi:MAG: hypothetical protein LBJ13_02325 [Puniceicoccales bacterium]|jgi:hypothetical protein|nr:hypothetical protein [Puniceicoccales bacterium]
METNKIKKVGHAAMYVGMLYMGISAVEGVRSSSFHVGRNSVAPQGNSKEVSDQPQGGKSVLKNTQRVKLTDEETGAVYRGAAQQPQTTKKQTDLFRRARDMRKAGKPLSKADTEALAAIFESRNKVVNQNVTYFNGLMVNSLNRSNRVPDTLWTVYEPKVDNKINRGIGVMDQKIQSMQKELQQVQQDVKKTSAQAVQATVAQNAQETTRRLEMVEAELRLLGATPRNRDQSGQSRNTAEQVDKRLASLGEEDQDVRLRVRRFVNEADARVGAVLLEGMKHDVALVRQTLNDRATATSNWIANANGEIERINGEIGDINGEITAIHAAQVQAQTQVPAQQVSDGLNTQLVDANARLTNASARLVDANARLADLRILEGSIGGVLRLVLRVDAVSELYTEHESVVNQISENVRQMAEKVERTRRSLDILKVRLMNAGDPRQLEMLQQRLTVVTQELENNREEYKGVKGRLITAMDSKLGVEVKLLDAHIAMFNGARPILATMVRESEEQCENVRRGSLASLGDTIMASRYLHERRVVSRVVTENVTGAERRKVVVTAQRNELETERGVLNAGNNMISRAQAKRTREAQRLVVNGAQTNYLASVLGRMNIEKDELQVIIQEGRELIANQNGIEGERENARANQVYVNSNQERLVKVNDVHDILAANNVVRTVRREYESSKQNYVNAVALNQLTPALENDVTAKRIAHAKAVLDFVNVEETAARAKSDAAVAEERAAQAERNNATEEPQIALCEETLVEAKTKVELMAAKLQRLTNEKRDLTSAIRALEVASVSRR